MSEHLKVCGEVVKEVTDIRFFSRDHISREVGRTLLENTGYVIEGWEVYPRVDIVAHKGGRDFRIELKLISNIPFHRNLVLRALRSTRSKMHTKQLDLLVITSVTRKVEPSSPGTKGYKRIKTYCIIGITMSRPKLEKNSDEILANEVIDEFYAALDEGEEPFEFQLAEVQAVRAEIEEVDTKVEEVDTKVEEVDTKVEEVDTKVEEVDAKVEDIQKRLSALETKIDGTQETLNTLTANIELLLKLSREK